MYINIKLVFLFLIFHFKDTIIINETILLLSIYIHLASVYK